jgi:hypothetical protein
MRALVENHALRLLLLGIILCSIPSGCAQNVRFRTVDAVTGIPISNVSVRTHRTSAFEYFNRSNETKSVGSTDKNGEIEIKDFSKRTLVYFDKRPYLSTYAAIVSCNTIQVGSISTLNDFTNQVITATEAQSKVLLVQMKQ